MNRLFHLGMLLLATAVALGCGNSKKPREMASVSGTVTIDGKPLADGEIYFKKTDSGEVDILPITDGRFEGDVGTGPRRVEIYAYREKEIVPMPGAPPEKTREVIVPARYNTESTLTAEIKPADTAPLKFEVTSK